MLISSRKELRDTPFKTAASKLRQKCPYFKFGNAHRVQYVWLTLALLRAETQAWEAVLWRELGGILLGYFPAECATITRIRKSWITFCQENRNGQIYNRVFDSRLFSFKNKRQILVRVGAEFQKNTMDRERKKCLSSQKPAYCCSSLWTDNRSRARNEGNTQRVSRRWSPEAFLGKTKWKEHQSWDSTLMLGFDCTVKQWTLSTI